MPTKWGWPSDRLCLDSGGKLGFLGLGFLGLTQSQVPSTEGASLLVGCRQSKASLVTDCAWTPGAKLVFLG